MMSWRMKKLYQFELVENNLKKENNEIKPCQLEFVGNMTIASLQARTDK